MPKCEKLIRLLLVNLIIRSFQIQEGNEKLRVIAAVRNLLLKRKILFLPMLRIFVTLLMIKIKYMDFHHLCFWEKRSANNANDIAKLFSDDFEPLFVSGGVSNIKY